MEEVVDQIGAVGGEDAEGIAHFVMEAGVLERNFKMPRFFLRSPGGEFAVDRQATGIGIFAGIKSGWIGGHDGKRGSQIAQGGQAQGSRSQIGR